jgi:acyl carrier protein
VSTPSRAPRFVATAWGCVVLDSDDSLVVSPALEERVFRGVRSALLRIDRRLRPEIIQPHTSLVADLGLDSIKFVGLGIALEEALDIPEFPMQDWSDQESSRSGGFTVASLVAVCLKCVRAEKGL